MTTIAPLEHARAMLYRHANFVGQVRAVVEMWEDHNISAEFAMKRLKQLVYEFKSESEKEATDGHD